MHVYQFDQEIKMLKHESEMNSKMFLFVNPYEINPGNSRLQNHIDSGLTTQISPTLVKTSFGNVRTCELLQPNPTKRVKVEMEEFSNLGELIPSLREKCVMDEYYLKTDEAENISNVSLQPYESQSLEDFVDTQDSQSCENQLYIDYNEHINLDDINESDFHILQQELSSDCANSDLKVHDNNNSINNSNLVNEISNIYQLEVNTRTFNLRSDHSYSNISSPSNSSITSEFVPMDIVKPITYGENRSHLNEKTMELNLGVKLFVGDTLNTPEILESVVSLEDERFNFLNCLSNKNLQTINEADLTFEPTLSAQIKEESLIIQPETLKKKSRKRKKYDSDDDYVPPITIRIGKKTAKIVETDSESDEDYVPVSNLKLCKERSRRISSLSSESSKDSNGVSKYRELRDKNNESSRKSRLKRRVKEQEMELEAQELENKNVKLKTEVEQLQRVVDNLRSNLFQIMIKK
ncbi:hypothetical protein WA026_003769 [Henosepilachna vigintioctopunctata]|uniref:BZIP domain-containing protein n=1 Tax=Henosepilachna vigintioctopunctata TaxID=420089 RepID=A0AAW1U8J6_9CUCU